MARLFQTDIAKNIGLPIDDFIVTEDAQQVRDVLNRYQNGHRGIERFDVRFTKTTGEENWVEMTLTPIKSYNDDSLTSIAATVVDIQERVVAEQILLDAKHQAETLAESKSRFMANISHEIRTPLNAVIGCADILHDTGLTTEQKRYTQMIKTSSDALLSILDDVLTYSRFEAQAISIDNQPFSLDTCLEEAIDIVSESAVQKGLELIFDFYPDVPAQVVGDHVRIRQIAINLLSNAIKFTQTGSLIIKAKCIEFDNNNFTLQLSIKDTGIGIAKNKLDSMFKPFIQSDNSITREHGGSGLGLAICKQICDAAGGSISVGF
ncbi:sensor histidine kinase [Pseudoalteromonas espejiana]